MDDEAVRRSLHRRLAVLALACAGGAALLLGAGLRMLVERTLSPDRVVEARTEALLWTVRVRLIVLGASGLLAAWAVGSDSFRARLRRLNAHPRSWTAIAGLIFVYAVIGLHVDPYLVSDLRPTPDAAEYAVSARQLMTTGSYTIPAGEAVFPPRYPFGYPLLIVPFYRAFGAQLSNAVLCSLTLVALTAALVYRTGERVWGRTAGVVAGLLTLSNRAAIDAGRAVMSEAAAMLAVALAAWLIVRLMEQRRSAWGWGLPGICIGAGAAIRFSNVLLLGPAALVLLWKGMNRDEQGIQDRPLWAVACLCGGCGIALAPLMIYQAEAFGGLLRTGYSFWVPYYYEAPGHTFSLRYTFQGPALGEAMGLPNALFYGGLLAGWGRSCYAPPTAAFVVIGAIAALRGVKGQAVALFALGTTAVTFLFYALYFFAERRFLAPAIPPLMLLAGCGVEAAVDPSGWRRGWTAFCNIFFLWVVAEGLVAVGAGGAASVPRRYETARLIARRTEADAVVVSGIDPMFLRVTAGRQAVPISRRVEYASKVVLPRPIREAVPEDVARDPERYAAWALARGGRRPAEVVAAEAPDRIAGYIAGGRPVYCDDYDLRGEDAPLRARFRFEPVDSVAGVHLYRLRMPW